MNLCKLICTANGECFFASFQEPYVIPTKTWSDWIAFNDLCQVEFPKKHKYKNTQKSLYKRLKQKRKEQCNLRLIARCLNFTKRLYQVVLARDIC